MSSEIDQGQKTWELINPEAEYEIKVQSIAPRLPDLKGTKIGLFWNGKPGAEVLLDEIGRLLKEKFAGLETVRFDLCIGAGPDNVKKMAKECDAVIGAIGDCGSCTSWILRDAIGIEKLGKPTVSFVTDYFVQLGKLVNETQGYPSLRMLDVPHPIADISVDVIKNRASQVLEKVIAGLTQPRPDDNSTSKKIVKPEPPYIQITADTETNAVQKMYDFFYEKKWTDGLPIIPPTEEAVERMLSGSKRNPDELIGIVPPKMGRATVRNVAINAVMAGALPEYLPVILTAVEAITDATFASGRAYWGAAGMLTTTGPVTPLLVVNGPITERLEITSGAGCFSRGHRANATIGRALRLVCTNAGGSYPGISDMKCQGSSQEFTFCVAEREEHPVYHNKNPWQPLSVEKGFPTGTNTVTAFATFPPVCAKEATHSGTAILDPIVDTMTTYGHEPYATDWEYVVIFSSTVAQRLADAGLGKQEIREYLYANAVEPWGKYKEQYGDSIDQPKFLRWTRDDATSVHIVDSPANINIIVAGGEGVYSQVVRCSFKGTTKEIIG